MRRTVPALAGWLLALGACTPLGLWVYDDPSFAVRLDDAGADSALTVALDVRNPNDYDVLTERFDLRLRLDGHTVGRFERDSSVPVPKYGSTTVSLAFTPAAGVSRGRLGAFRRGTTRLVVEGRAVLSTPFGKREVPVGDPGE